MKNFIEKEFIKYYLGNTQIRNHVDAVHAVPPYADQFTGEIVTGLINKINCSGIISKVSRKKIDLNRRRNVNNKEAIDEYRNAIHSILTYLSLFEENNQILKQPYLHLAIHGMKDTHNKEIIIGTRNGESCSSDIKRWFVDEVSRYYENIIADQIFPGDSSKSVHRLGDCISDLSYKGYGDNFNTIQIEINRTLRENHRQKLISILSDIIIDFNKKFV
jgi:hypothetical protein